MSDWAGVWTPDSGGFLDLDVQRGAEAETQMGLKMHRNSHGRESNQRPFDLESNAQPLHHQDNPGSAPGSALAACLLMEESPLTNEEYRLPGV